MADGTEEGLDMGADVAQDSGAVSHNSDDSSITTSLSDSSDTSSKEVDDALADVDQEERELNKEEQAIGDVSDSTSQPVEVSDA